MGRPATGQRLWTPRWNTRALNSPAPTSAKNQPQRSTPTPHLPMWTAICKSA